MVAAESNRLLSRTEDRQKPMLIIADADVSHLYYTSILLQRLEYNIYTTKTAEGVLELLDFAKPALILTAVSLEGLDGNEDGLEMLRKIKRIPRTYSIPVIILSSSRDQAIKDSCMQAGCAAFLLKPLEPDMLYAAIQKATESTPRQYIRLNTSSNVIVGDDKKMAAPAMDDYITALSENGMFVSTPSPLPVGSQVPFTIMFEKVRIKADGVVLYIFKRGEGPLKTAGMGVQFTRIGQEDQGMIKAFIRREIVKGLYSR